MRACTSSIHSPAWAPSCGDSSLIPTSSETKTLERKFREELHANEILPLAYYMASINVEETFRERIEARDSEDPGLPRIRRNGMARHLQCNDPSGDAQQASMQFMQDNDKRERIRQDETQIGVIIGNPPYSRMARPTQTDDNNQNVVYESYAT